VPFEVFEKLTSQYSEHSTGKVLKPGFVYISHYTTLTANLVPRVFLVVARELRKTLVKYDEISKILGDLSHAQ
jgi:hypothetical protein